jgi:hypothetical protein
MSVEARARHRILRRAQDEVYVFDALYQLSQDEVYLF